jgi:RNA polymerase sigma-70 factor (ECF subfamily)
MAKQQQQTMHSDPPTGPILRFSRTQHREELKEATDRELLGALVKDDEAALDELIKRKTRPLMQQIYRMVGDMEEARDIVQVTFLRVWQNRERFDRQWSPNTWIYRIASNLAIDHIRSRRSRDRSAEPVRFHLQEVIRPVGRGELGQAMEKEVMAIFQELAAGLTEKQRAVFLLREVEGLSSKEVAEIVGCRESTVRNHLFNARIYLRKKVVERYPEYAQAYIERQGRSST